MSHDRTRDPATPPWRPPVLDIGAREAALERFFYDCTWEGTVYANGQGPGSPEMTAVGGGTCRWIMDGLWLACDFHQDQYAGGEYVLTWRLHLVVGWDRMAGEYRAVLAESNGALALLRGDLEGDTLTMTPVERLAKDGVPVDFRFVWDAGDPQRLAWRTEFSAAGGPWTRVEDYVVRPASRA